MKIITDTELAEAFKRRGNDPFWKEIYSIQTIVQAKVGLGQPVFVDFLAPINSQSPSDSVNYDFRSFKADSLCTLQQYCLKQ